MIPHRASALRAAVFAVGPLSIALLAASAGLWFAGCQSKSAPPADFSATSIHGVRFDPSYYYNLKQPLSEFLDSNMAVWQTHGINTVFFKAYDPEYGAVYATHYAGNSETDYGKQDLLRLFLKAAHARGLRVLAWLPVFEHKGAWDAHPDWRIKAKDGSDLKPFPDRHFLCVRQPGFTAWWQGFLADLLAHYPELDGVDFAEPAAVWKSQVCSCPECKRTVDSGGRAELSPEAVAARARGLTDLLLASSKQVRAAGRIACVTFIATAAASTDLMPFARQRELSGLDLDRLLDSPDKPQWLSAELMWQQWADLYDNPAAFRPEWTRKAVEQTLAQVGTRAHLLAHVEITPLGPVEVSPDELVASIKAAREGGARSVEFYDTHLADSLGAWPALDQAWRTESERKAVVIHDPGGLGTAKQVAVLFGHFGLASSVTAVDSFSEALVHPNDLVVYVGNKENYALPAAFLRFVQRLDHRVFWCDFNLWQIDRPLAGEKGDTNTYKEIKPGQSSAPSNGFLAKLGLRFEYPHRSPEYSTVLYKGQELFKNDSTMNRVAVLDSAKASVLARVRTKNGEVLPYIVQSGNFWFVADCPTDYIVEGGRDVAFADLLHEFVGEIHPDSHTALVRIEDVCALSDPAAIRGIADLLSGEGVPFSLALVPDYVDPEDNVNVTLSDRPELVKALHYAVSKGAAIVMHGDTHQYRGRSTHDYEFWDALHDTPIFEDSREYVRARLQRGIDEMRRNGLYPIVFETPHYACSQTDYSVIDQFFSAEYARRQVIDKTGFDQLVPYFIARHPSGNSIIPENLGYIPNLKQEAGPMLRCAKNNLAVRDGFASFFFHPWIKREVLRDLVQGIKGMGYTFADIRTIPLKMSAKGIAQATGNREVTLDPGGKFLRTFYMDPKGSMHDEWVSDGPVGREFTKQAHCPPGWTFVAEAVDKPAPWWAKFALPKISLFGNLRERLINSPPLVAEQGRALRPCVLLAPDSSARGAHAPKGFGGGQAAWMEAFRAVGVEADTLAATRFLDVPQGDNLLVVPASAAAALSPQQALAAAQWAARGNDIVLEGPSAISDRMGIHAVDSNLSVREVRDDFLPQVKIEWPAAARLYAFDADSAYVNEYSTPEDRPVLTGGSYGRGKYLFFAAPFASPLAAPGADAGKPAETATAATGGAQRFPFFLETVRREMDLHPALHANRLEIYFDPGSREDVPLEELARNWRKNGVRAVYVAGWHDYEKYTFEYGYLAELLHENGILAYAWLDLPGISDRFWQDHPQWREKNALGKDAEMDAEIGWKQYMNMTNDTCRAGAYNSIKRLLLMAPWDGAVLTGRLFSGDNPDSAASVTPFHPSFRARYAADKGYDPARIFDPVSPYYHRHTPRYWKEFVAYRDSLEVALTSDAIGFLGRQRPLQKPGSEIILTRPLDKLAPEALSAYVRMAAANPQVRLQSAYVPATLGADGLERDVAAWRARLPAWNPMLEIHLDRERPAGGSTARICGGELLNLVARAGVVGARLTLRTEDLIYDTDFRDLAFAAAAGSRQRAAEAAWIVDAHAGAELDLDPKSNPQVLVDGKIWPAYDRGRVLMPRGEHKLEGCPRLVSWRTLLQAPVRVQGFNGEILDASNTFQGLSLHYVSPVPATLALTQAPLQASLDGLPYLSPATQVARAGGAPTASAAGTNAALALPAGEHWIDVKTRSFATSLMRQTSVGLSVAIIIISSVTVAAFALLYLGGAARRLYSGDPGHADAHRGPNPPVLR